MAEDLDDLKDEMDAWLDDQVDDQEKDEPVSPDDVRIYATPAQVFDDMSTRCEETHCDVCGANDVPVVWHKKDRWCRSCFLTIEEPAERGSGDVGRH